MVISKHVPSQAVSPRSARVIPTTEVLDLQMGKGGALVEKRRCGGACMMDGMTCQRQCSEISDADFGFISDIDVMATYTIEIHACANHCVINPDSFVKIFPF